MTNVKVFFQHDMTVKVELRDPDLLAVGSQLRLMEGQCITQESTVAGTVHFHFIIHPFASQAGIRSNSPLIVKRLLSLTGYCQPTAYC